MGGAREADEPEACSSCAQPERVPTAESRSRGARAWKLIPNSGFTLTHGAAWGKSLQTHLVGVGAQ